jgi:hypothetical protein
MSPCSHAYSGDGGPTAAGPLDYQGACIGYGGGVNTVYYTTLTLSLGMQEAIHCTKSVLKIQEYIHKGANLKFYINHRQYFTFFSISKKTGQNHY